MQEAKTIPSKPALTLPRMSLIMMCYSDVDEYDFWVGDSGTLATWIKHRDGVHLPFFMTAALEQNKITCIHLVTWYIMLHWLHKCRSMLPIQIWILAFCLCYPFFFLLCTIVDPILSFTLARVIALLSSSLSIIRYQLPGNSMKILLFFFSIFSLLHTHLETCASTQRDVLHLKSLLHLLSVIWHCCATRFCDSQGGIKTLNDNYFEALYSP